MRQFVGVADMHVSDKQGDTIVTYSLGACIGLAIYDPQIKAGGILHFMLPDSSIDREKALINPYMFADSGIPQFLRHAFQLGIKKERMRVFVAGGAQIINQNDSFNIGNQNYIALKKILFKNDITIEKQSIGGNVNRTINLELASGGILLKYSDGQEEKI